MILALGITFKSRFRLAPLYDVISSLPYVKQAKDAKLAMSIDKHYRFDQIQPRHWEAQARTAGYSADRMLAHIRDLLARLPEESVAMIKVFKTEGMHSTELDTLVGLLAERCKALRSLYGSQAMAGNDLRLPGL